MKLPTELRVQILRYVLVSPDPIELWPETGLRYNEIMARKRNHRKWRAAISGPKRKFQVQLLRCCKQLNEEGAEIFYGENHFRFSGSNGWVVAAGWFHKIGLRHTKWLTRLTLPVPFLHGVSGQYVSWNNAQVGEMSWRQWGIWSSVIGWRLNFNFPYRFKDFRDIGIQAMATHDVFLILMKAGRLRELNLVLPDWFDFRLHMYDDDMTQERFWAWMVELKMSLGSQFRYGIVRMVEDDAVAVEQYTEGHLEFFREACLRSCMTRSFHTTPLLNETFGTCSWATIRNCSVSIKGDSSCGCGEDTSVIGSQRSVGW
jgi:hypothetical protein